MATIRNLDYATKTIMAALEKPPVGCLLWPGTKTKNGYGVVRLADGSRTTVNRYALMLRLGHAIGDEFHAAHECGNRACMNPWHINAKTPKENDTDKIAHRTAPRYEGLRKNNTTGYRNVTFIKKLNRYAAAFMHEQQSRFLGYFDCPKEAARVADIARLAAFGPDISLNFPLSFYNAQDRQTS